MRDALDFVAAQAVAHARLLERACHDSGPWEIEVQGMRIPAVRARTPHAVIFLATFPEMCWVEPPDTALLYCADELVGARPIVAPGEGAYTVRWTIGTAAHVEPQPINW